MNYNQKLKLKTTLAHFTLLSFLLVYNYHYDIHDAAPAPRPPTTPQPVFTGLPRTRRPAEEISTTTFNGKTTTKGNVIFYDNFDGNSISQSKWQYTVKIADAPVSNNLIIIKIQKNVSYLNIKYPNHKIYIWTC